MRNQVMLVIETNLPDARHIVIGPGDPDRMMAVRDDWLRAIQKAPEGVGMEVVKTSILPYVKYVSLSASEMGIDYLYDIYVKRWLLGDEAN